MLSGGRFQNPEKACNLLVPVRDPQNAMSARGPENRAVRRHPIERFPKMPNVSDKVLVQFQEKYAAMKRRTTRAITAGRERSLANQVKGVGENLLGAAGIGAIRGKMEEPDGSWNIPGTEIDAEVAVGLACVGLGFAAQQSAPLKTLKPAADDLINIGSGVLAHYTGQLARKFAKTGQVSFVAGADVGGAYPASVGGMDMPGSVDAAMASALQQTVV